MATIANLLVKIEATDKAFQRGMKAVASSVKKVKDDAVKAFKFIAKAIAIPTAALGSLLYALNSIASEIDKLAKTSSKLGIGVGELQKLQYQAKLSGVSVETLNMALQRMVRRVAEAAKGTGEAVGALQELGLDADMLNKASPDQQFNMIADAMKRIPLQADKVRLAMKLFDSEGVALVNTLNQDLRSTGDEFDRLGIKITETDAKMVEAYNDAKTKLGAIWEGFKQQVTVQAVPALEKLIEETIKGINKMGGLKKVATEVAITIVKSVQTMVEAFRFLADVIQSIKVAYQSLTAGVTKATAWFAKTRETNQKVAEAMNAGKSLDEIAKIYKESKEKGDKIYDQMAREQNDQLGKMVNEIGKRNEILNKMVKALEKESAKLDQAAQKTKTPVGQNNLDLGQGYGSITDLATGKTIQIGKQSGQQNVNVQIVADKERLVNAVVTSDQFRNTLQTEAAAATRDAARATRR